MAKNVLIVVCLIVLGVLVFCLCCYKVTNLLFQLFTIDSQDSTDMVSPLENEKHMEKPMTLQQLHNTTNKFSHHEKGGLPPEYRDTPDHVIHVTPRCSRHAAAAHARDREKFVDSYNSSSTHELISNGKENGHDRMYHSKEELALVNMNHYPSTGELRYTSVERLLPPYPQIKSHSHRTSNGAAVGGLGRGRGRGQPSASDNPQPSYSYSYTNINCGQDSHHSHHKPCCSNNSSYGYHTSLPQPHHHIATMRRTPVSSHSEHSRWCGSAGDFHIQPALPPSSQSQLGSNNNTSFRHPYNETSGDSDVDLVTRERLVTGSREHGIPREHPRDSAYTTTNRPLSRESLEDREVSAMFHRDTLLARIVRL